MAEVKFDKGSEEWQMFVEYWQMCQKFWEPEVTEEYWQQLVKAMNDFYEKFKNIPLARKLAVAFGDTQDEKFNINRK